MPAKSPAQPRPELIALLDAIKDNPDDDTPRLIYADWLDDQGDVRGEFIRTQAALAGLAEDDPRHGELSAVCEALWEEHGERLLGPLAELLPVDHYEPVWRRGFVEELIGWGRAAVVQFTANAAAIFRLTPLRAVRFRPSGGIGRKDRGPTSNERQQNNE